MNSSKTLFFVAAFLMLLGRSNAESVLIQRGAGGTTVHLNGIECDRSLDEFDIYPDTWAVCANLKWIAFPIKVASSSENKRIVHVRFAGIGVVGISGSTVVTSTQLSKFEGWNKNWFELEKVLGVDITGNKILACMRYRDTPTRIRSELTLIDLIEMRCAKQESLFLKLFE